MGQEDIARLWSVDLRLVKQEMARLRASGWLVETRSAARVRVALHAIDLGLIMTDIQQVWATSVTDFIAGQQPDSAAPPSAMWCISRLK